MPVTPPEPLLDGAPHAVADRRASGSPPLPLRRLRSRPVVVMAVLTTIANVVNYASSLVFSRVLEPVGFGELAALLALTLVIAVPATAAQIVIAERVAVYSAAGRMDTVQYLLRHSLAHVATIALVVGVIYGACIPLVVDLMNIRQPGPAIAALPVIVLGFIVPVALGVVQGLDRMVAFGIMTLGVAVARLAFGVPWAALGGGAGGALAGQAFGMLFVLAAAAWLLRDLLIGRGTWAARRGVRRKLDLRALSATGAIVGFAAISSLDLPLAKIFLSEHDGGIYAAIATVGKVILFLPSAVAVIMVPRAARARAESGSSHQVLRKAAALVAALAIVAALIPVAFPHLVVKVMFGAGYGEAASGMLPIVVAGGALAMLNLLVIYSVTVRTPKWLWLLGFGLLLQVGLISLHHGSPAQVAAAQAATAVVVLIINEIFFHSLLRARRT